MWSDIGEVYYGGKWVTTTHILQYPLNIVNDHSLSGLI